MDGLDFQTASPPVASDPARADVALFVGFVHRRPVPPRAPNESDASYLSRLPASLRAWLDSWGWTPGRDARTAEDLVHLLDIPAPVDAWETFDALFDWDHRPLDPSGRFCESTLGAAVRRFFTQGGRRAYVVRLGDPWPPLTPLTDRSPLRDRVLPGADAGSIPPNPYDRATWHGVAHLFGLPDVSFVCIPDLPELFAVDVAELPPEQAPDSPERFVECSSRAAPEITRSLRHLPAPRLDAAGFHDWALFVRALGDFIRRRAPEAQLLAALPLAIDDSALAVGPGILALDRTARRGAVRAALFAARQAQWREAGTIATAFVQLAFPWLRTRASTRLPGDLEPPDAFLAGILAQNALTTGTWHSASRWPVPELATTLPVLARSDLEREFPFAGPDGHRRLPLTLRQRVSVFALTPRGYQLLSDVTTSSKEAYRPANLSRLVASILRAARVVGENAVFDNNGQALWDRLRAALEGLLLNLWSAGALAGNSPSEAYQVHCDRSTMTRNDLDSGRVIARVQFTAAAPIEHITVVLALEDSGAIALLPARESAQGNAPGASTPAPALQVA